MLLMHIMLESSDCQLSSTVYHGWGWSLPLLYGVLLRRIPLSEDISRCLPAISPV